MKRRVEQDGVIERILADQPRRDVARDDSERGEAALHRRGFTNAAQPIIGMDPDPGAALLRPIVRRPADLEDLDLAYFHARLQ